MTRPEGLAFPIVRCAECRGSWLDLEEIKCRLPNPSSLWQALSKEGTTTDFSCPACRNRPLSAAKYGDNEIDWCPTCKGVFFDAGEIAAIRITMQQNRLSRAGGSVMAHGVVDWEVGDVIVEAVGWVIEAIID